MNDFAIKVLTERKTSMFYVGQAGYIFKSSSGQLLGVDLYLSDCVERIEGHMGFKRLLPKILFPMELEFNVIIATHSHFDHFDMDAIPSMMSNHKTYLIASNNCEREIKKLDMIDGNNIFVKPGDEIEIGDFYLRFVDCDHGFEAPDAVGLIVKVDGKFIYITGDTCMRMDRISEIRAGINFDIIIGPINGANGNMNEGEFADYAHALEGKLIIPCHYGMFASHGGNPGKFLDIMRKKYPNDTVLIMSQGERLVL